MSGEAVKVVVRCRPMNQREKDLNSQNIVDVDTARSQVMLKFLEDPKSPPKQFTFDGAYGTESNTEMIYNDVGFALVESVCEGYNGTVFAYGQTGCGKSFTMQGIKDNQTQKGIIPRSFEHIFEAIAIDTTKKYLIRGSYLEIYNENVRDLLGKDYKTTLDLHESPDKGVYVSGLSYHECKQVNDCEKLMDKGNKNRSTGATLMNADSSRSHSIFTITVEMCEQDNEGEEHYKAGKLNLVDLAGSERQSKTGATGDRLKEATKINLSLSALGNVISALVDGKSKHIPYRDSKLTRLLQDSLGGNTKTLMIAALSPAADNYEETLSTLRYANRAKSIKNKPKINEDPKDAMLRQLQDEINLLKAQLAGKVPVSVSQTSNYNTKRDQIEDEKQKLRKEFEEKIREVEQQYEEEKMSKEALMKQMESLKVHYDLQIDSLEDSNKIDDLIINGNVSNEKPLANRKSARLNRKSSSGILKKISSHDSNLNNMESEPPVDINDPRERLQKLQELVVGGEQANNEELKKKRIKKKKHAEERKLLLAESLRNGNDDEFMLSVYDSVQEEVKYKTKQLEKEKASVTFLQNEVKDLQHEFEREREEYLDTIRKQEKQIKLLHKLLQKIQPIIPHDCNFYNLDKVQTVAVWNEEYQDWSMPDLKREKLSLPTMTNNEHELELTSSQYDLNLMELSQTNLNSNSGYLQMQIPQQNVLLNSRRQLNMNNQNDQVLTLSREPEIDRYKMKLENSQFDGNNYFKTKRQSELLTQTQDLKNSNKLAPINNNTISNKNNWRPQFP